MTSCTEGVEPDGVSITVLVLIQYVNTHMSLGMSIHTFKTIYTQTHQQLEGCSANENSLLVS